MKKIMIKYTMELDLDDYERFLRLRRINNKYCHHMFQDDFIKAGETAIRKRLQEV